MKPRRGKAAQAALGMAHARRTQLECEDGAT